MTGDGTGSIPGTIGYHRSSGEEKRRAESLVWTEEGGRGERVGGHHKEVKTPKIKKKVETDERNSLK